MADAFDGHPGRRAGPVGVRARRRRAARRLGRRRHPRRPARGRPLPRPRDPGHRHRQRRASTCRSRSPTGASGRSPSTCAPRPGARSSTSCSRRADVLLTSLRPGALRPPRPRRRRGARALPAARVRPGPRLRRARPRRRPARATTPRPSGPAAASATCSPRPTATTRSRQRGAFGDRNGGDGARLRRSPPRCSGGRAPARARWSTSRCWPPRCGRCRPTCSRRCRAAATACPGGPRRGEPAGRPPTGPRTAATSSSCSSSPIATGPTSARSIGRRRPRRRPALRRPRTPAASTPQACVAELDERVRDPHLRGVEGSCSAGIDAPWAPVQAVEELLDDPQVLANDYLGEVDARRRRHLPAAARSRCSSTSGRPTCAGLPSTASTPRRCCSSSATPGTTSAASARPR